MNRRRSQNEEDADYAERFAFVRDGFSWAAFLLRAAVDVAAFADASS